MIAVKLGLDSCPGFGGDRFEGLGFQEVRIRIICEISCTEVVETTVPR